MDKRWLYKMRFKFKNVSKDQWIELLERHRSITKIATELKCNPTSIRNNLIKHEINYQDYLEKTNYDSQFLNKKFGKLYVQKIYIKKEKKNRKYCWCLCDCGKEREFRLDDVVRGVRISCCHSETRTWQRGKDHPSYTGVEELSGAYFGALKSAANYRKIEFNLTKEYLWYLYLQQDKKCKLSGMELYFPKGSNLKTGNISLDRIDSSKPYIENNVQWVHKDVNMMKNAYSNEYFIEICRLVCRSSEGIAKAFADQWGTL